MTLNYTLEQKTKPGSIHWNHLGFSNLPFPLVLIDIVTKGFINFQPIIRRITSPRTWWTLPLCLPFCSAVLLEFSMAPICQVSITAYPMLQGVCTGRVYLSNPKDTLKIYCYMFSYRSTFDRFYTRNLLTNLLRKSVAYLVLTEIMYIMYILTHPCNLWEPCQKTASPESSCGRLISFIEFGGTLQEIDLYSPTVSCFHHLA